MKFPGAVQRQEKWRISILVVQRGGGGRKRHETGPDRFAVDFQNMLVFPVGQGGLDCRRDQEQQKKTKGFENPCPSVFIRGWKIPNGIAAARWLRDRVHGFRQVLRVYSRCAMVGVQLAIFKSLLADFI